MFFEVTSSKLSDLLEAHSTTLDVACHFGVDFMQLIIKHKTLTYLHAPVSELQAALDT